MIKILIKYHILLNGNNADKNVVQAYLITNAILKLPLYNNNSLFKVIIKNPVIIIHKSTKILKIKS